MRFCSWLLVGVLLVALGGCGASQSVDPASGSTAAPASAGQTDELVIFAAASLTNAFTELGQNFEAANPGTKLIFNYGGSQALALQINEGAPVDVFASANKAQMEVAIKSGRIISDSQHIFVHNRLVVIYPQDNPGGLTSLKDLAKPGITIVLAAKSVPVGGYALDFLGKASQLPEYTAGYSETVLANVISYEENVNAVLGKIVLGEVDAGIVYTSDISRASADKVGQIAIPDDLNTIASYPIAPINDSKKADLSKKFIDYVLSKEGQVILVKYGFIAANSVD